MNESINPLLPAGYDVVWSLVAVAVLVLTVAAAVSVLRSARLTALGRVLWIVVLVAVPVLGAAAWFAVGRTARLSTDTP